MPVSQDNSYSGSETEDLVLSPATTGTLDGNGGDDILMADFGSTLMTSGGSSAGTAVNLDADLSYWYTSATHNNPLIGDPSVPHMTAILTTIAGSSSFFTIAVPPGATLSLDIDAASGRAFNGVTAPDLFANFSVGGIEVASFDDNLILDTGSTGSLDPRGSWTNTGSATVTVVINIGIYSSSGPAPYVASGAVFLTHFSLSGHATGGTAGSDNSNLIGELGHDFLSGGFGNDDLYGESGFDSLFGGDGSDRLNGGADGDDLDGGEGIDTAEYSTVVTIDLGDNTGTGDAQGDTWVSIERFDLSNGDDTFLGAEGDDFVDGDFGDDTLSGRAGNDRLYGSYGNDYLVGGAGDDTLHGSYGDDIISGDEGLDILDGDFGDDILYAVHGQSDIIRGGFGRDALVLTISSGAAANTFDFVQGEWRTAGQPTREMSGIERFFDSDNASTVITALSSKTDSLGNFYVNEYVMKGGDDRVILTSIYEGSSAVDLGTGDDFIRIDDCTIGDNDDVNGGDGVDTVSFAITDLQLDGANDVVIDLVAGTLSGSTGSDTLAGFENVVGSLGSETVLGTSGANSLHGLAGDDVLEGRAGNDTLVGGGGDDRLAGGDGNDYLDGTSGGTDLLYGGNGDDIYVVYDSADLIFEVAAGGYDIVNTYYSLVLPAHFERANVFGTVGLTITGNGLDNRLVGNVGNDAFTGGNGADVLNGQGGNDTLSGNDGNDYILGGTGTDGIFGGTGFDIVKGEAGDDTVRGGAGNDHVFGGTGRDFLYGDEGGDLFFFATGDTAATRAEADVIGDFSKSAGDLLHLIEVDANTLLSGDQAFSFIGTGAFSNVAGQLRYEQVSGNTYVEGDMNGDGVADFVLRLNGTIALAAADFVL